MSPSGVYSGHQKNSGSFKKGNIPWNKEKKYNKEMKKRLNLNGLIHGESSKNANWKGGIGKMYAVVVAKKNLEQKCNECGIINNLHVHHIDGNQNNNDLRNLRMLCASCHCKLHRRKE